MPPVDANPGLAAIGDLCRGKFFATAADLDAVITTDPVHIGYLSGYRSILHDIGPYPQALIATRERIALVTGASDAAAALEVLNEPDEIWRYGRFYVGSSADTTDYRNLPPTSDSFHAVLTAAVSTFDLRGKRVGLDLDQGQASVTLRHRLDSARLEDAAGYFRLSRMTKLDEELVLLRKASRMTDESIGNIHSLIRAGVSELEIASEISRHIVRSGGIPRFVVVTSGERSARVDAYASEKRLAGGDLVRIDVGCTLNGYCSDMARTFVVGTPTELQRTRYEALLDGELAQLDMLKPGVLASELYDVAMREVRSGALPDYQRNHCGHAIGLRPHEYPAIAPGNDVTLQPGMVFCVETPYYELGWGGMMVEDTAIITEGGHELLTVSSRRLQL